MLFIAISTFLGLSPTAKDKLKEVRLAVIAKQRKRTDAGKRRVKAIYSKLYYQAEETLLHLNGYICGLAPMQEYIKIFQSSGTLAHLLHYHQIRIFTNFLSLFVDPEATKDISPRRLKKLDLEANVLPDELIYSGDSNKALLELSSDTSYGKEYCVRLKTAFLAAGKYMQDKLPLNNPTLTALACLDPELKGCKSGIRLWTRLSDMLKRFIPPGIDIGIEIRRYHSDPEPCLNSFRDECPLGSQAVEYWNQDYVIKHYPGMSQVARAGLSVYSGPKVESTFSEAANIMDKRRSQLNVETYSSYQDVRYYLRSTGKSAVELFKLNDIVFGQPDFAVCAAMRQAASVYKAKIAKAKHEKDIRLASYGAKVSFTSAVAKRRAKADMRQQCSKRLLKLQRKRRLTMLAKKRRALNK